MVGDRNHSSDPVVIDNDNGLVISIPAELNPSRGGKAFWSSLRLETAEGKGRLLAAIQGELPKLSTCINTTLLVTDVVFHGVTVTEERSGEIKPAVRSIIVCKDGQMFSAVSDGIRTSLGLIMAPAMFGPPPWKPPLPLRMKQVDTSGKNRYYLLEYATGK